MSNVIASPGVQFNEIDLSFSTRTTNSNTVFVAGYALQGPIYEPTYVTSLPEFDQIFGVPTNSAERYMYHSARQILTKTSAQLLVTRLPYDVVSVDDRKLSRSVLVYPMSSDAVDGNTGLFDINSSTEYTLLPPINMIVEESIYSTIIQRAVDWSTLKINIDPTDTALSAVPVGLIVTNDSSTAVNNLFEGTYIGLADNTSADPSLGFNCITGIKTISTAPAVDLTITAPSFLVAGATNVFSYNAWQDVNPQRLNFTISAPQVSTGTKDTISEIVAKYPIGYKFDDAEFNDSLILTIFNLKKSIYETSNVQLADTLVQATMGSVNINKTRIGPEGGAAKSVFLESLVNGPSPYISVFINPTVARQDWEDTTTNIVSSKKRIKIHPTAKNLYALGTYNTINSNELKQLGNVPAKLQNALTLIDSADFYPIDITCDAGLSTIWTSIVCKNPDLSVTDTYYNDEELLGAGLLGNPKLNDLFTKTGGVNLNRVVDGHGAILSLFETFATTRKDHIHISDPLRHIFIEGTSLKRVDRRPDDLGVAFNFYNEIYWPLYHLYVAHSTSYVSTYCNWFAVADPTLRRNLWIPSSGVVAASIINSSPIEAPAGFTRGIISGVSDTAMSPSQKQRDQLYKLSQNAISVFPGEGTVIFGQKTLLNKPSAFDRLNVRRTFIYLEKSTNAVLKYFVFEPNTFLVRNRITNTLRPIFEQTKNAGGIYDYRIVCDERNNTPATIDANELHVDIYVKPTRTAEFILVNFYATRTDQNFSELIGNA